MNSISRLRLPRRFAPGNDRCAAVESVDEFHNAVVDGELDEWIKQYYGGDNETSDMTTGYYYDGLEGLAKHVGADEIEVVLEYEAFGNMVCRKDDADRERYEGLNRVFEYDFDRLGRLLSGEKSV